MRLARKLALLATMALAATAMAASTASASLVHTDEATGGPCTTVSVKNHVVSGGCVVHITSSGSVTMVAHIFGFESVDMVCGMEVTAHLDAAITGYLTNQSMTGGSSCPRRPCAEADNEAVKRPWPARGAETVPGGGKALTFTFCIWGLSSMTDTLCEITIPFGESSNHRYQFTASDTPCHGTAGFRGELTGTWNTENTGIEINHA